MESHFYLSLAFVLNLYASYQFMSLEPYMDEIFHIPQAQVYCQGDFLTWDPKITTFPGLYYFTYVVSQFLRLFSRKSTCTPQTLRVINFSLSCLLPFLLYKCGEKLNQKNKFIPTLLYVYPLSSFYYFLFYTDTISLVSFLLCYYLVLTVYPNSSSSEKLSVSLLKQLLLLLVATACLLTRQTNVVWLLFLAGTTMLHEVKRMGTLQVDECSISCIVQFVNQLWLWRNYLLYITWPLLLPVLGFVMFLKYNGSIVLGDKANHQAGIHLAMIAHCCLLYTILSLPKLCTLCCHHMLITPSQSHDKNEKQKPWYQSLRQYFFPNFTQGITNMVIMVIGGVCLLLGSKAHPFLLADNRHYMFYLWQRLLQHYSVRVLLTPVYGFAMLYTIQDLLQQKQSLWTLIFTIAAALTLLPTPLLEPRYFTTPLVIGLLNSSCSSSVLTSKIFQTFSQCLIIALMLFNGVIMYVYLYRSFIWQDGSLARFMF